MAYDIFISYRREGGSDVARQVQLLLENHGYKVFFDLDECNASSWEKRIKAGIEESKVFLFIMSKGSLDRCKNEGDWVSKEIEYAYQLHKEIIPVNPDKEFGDNEKFPEGCPSVVCEALGAHTYYEIFTGQQLKNTVESLVKDRIMPIVEPDKKVATGACIHLRSDMDCQVKWYDKPLCALEEGKYKDVYLEKGEHLLTAISVENQLDRVEKEFTIETDNSHKNLPIKLIPIRDARIAKENEIRKKQQEKELEAEFTRKAKEEAERRQQEAERKKQEEEIKRQKREEILQDVKDFLRETWWVILLLALFVSMAVWILKNENKEGKQPIDNNDVVVIDTLLTQSKQVTQQSTSGYINCHEWVDLGLSVKWATCNVGASSPSSYGNYYAWGDTSPKSTYTEDKSKTYGKTFADISGDARYDAARANWGGSWRMPTKAECEELVNNCTWTWTSQNGVKGYKVTSKKNGNSIFLPAAGCRYGSSLYDAGEYGYCWSSTPIGSDTEGAYYLIFNSGSHYVDWYSRGYGHSVRPVSE